MRAPLVLLQIVAWAFLSGVVQGEIDGAEFFAGDMAVTMKLQEAGFTCFPFELKLDSLCHDILSDPGFAFAVSLVCRVRCGGFVWFGIVCSTWVFMSRSTTGRDINHPLGRSTSNVVAANVMTSRVVLLFWLAAANGCFVILEQPATSLMFMHPRFQELIGFIIVVSCQNQIWFPPNYPDAPRLGGDEEGGVVRFFACSYDTAFVCGLRGWR